MKLIFKAAVVLVIIILLASSIYVVFFSGEEKKTFENDKPDDDGSEKPDGNDSDSDDRNNNGDYEFVHTVFVEEGTATWCSNCPYVAEILHDLYDPDDPDFYYVSMVEDKNSEAHERLYDDYNIYGFPTVFIDGGYQVIMGSKAGSEFEKKISEAASREVPRLYLNVNAEWNESSNRLTTTVSVENKETETYTGHLKVYITEINSRWSDWNGNPYDFAFLDYAVNKNVEIEKNDNETFSSKWDASYPDVYPENLWIIAVLFNSESKQGFSDPSENEHSFDAYYADATDATRVAEGTLPPSIGISSPKKGIRYIFGNEGRKTLTGKTVIIGKTTITVNIQADAGVEKVEFTVKGLLGENSEVVTKEPYEWTWGTFAFGKYTITAKVYDKEGRTATDGIDVIAFILGI